MKRDDIPEQEDLETLLSGPDCMGAELEALERKAVAAMGEMLPHWYNEAGMGGLLHSLVSFVKSLDGMAHEAEQTGSNADQARSLIARQIILGAHMSSPDNTAGLQALMSGESH